MASKVNFPEIKVENYAVALSYLVLFQKAPYKQMLKDFESLSSTLWDLNIYLEMDFSPSYDPEYSEGLSWALLQLTEMGYAAKYYRPTGRCYSIELDGLLDFQKRIPLLLRETPYNEQVILMEQITQLGKMNNLSQDKMDTFEKTLKKVNLKRIGQ